MIKINTILVSACLIVLLLLGFFAYKFYDRSLHNNYWKSISTTTVCIDAVSNVKNLGSNMYTASDFIYRAKPLLDDGCELDLLTFDGLNCSVNLIKCKNPDIDILETLKFSNGGIAYKNQ